MKTMVYGITKIYQSLYVEIKSYVLLALSVNESYLNEPVTGVQRHILEQLI